MSQLSLNVDCIETSDVMLPMFKKNLSKDFCFSPFLFIAWDFYRTGSLVNSIITCCRDFMWPVAAITAKSLNASPY
jgi:hypothetical protein